MPAELMLVNPRKRRRTKARKNPRRKMSALQMKYFGGGKRRKTHRRRRAAASAAPVRRRRRTHRRAAPAAVRRHTRRRSRRSVFSSKSGGVSLNPRSLLKSEIMPAIVGAVGAVAADVLWAALPIPANLKSGPLSPLVKAGVVIAGAYAVGKFANRKVGEAIATGGLLVIGYDVVKGLIKSAVPALPLSEYVSGDVGYISPAQIIYPPDIAQHMGQYISGSASANNGWNAGDVDVLDHVS